MERPLTSHRYYQLLARLELEQTSCQVRAGNQGRGLESLRRAESAANDGKLSSQKINVINYQSALEALKDGRSGPLWKMSRNALRLFWTGLLPDKRAYPFYSKLADWGEQNDLPFLFYEFSQEATSTIDFTDLTSFRAMAHFRFGEASLATKRGQTATDQFNRSEKLFQELPQNESVAVHRADVESLLAGLEAQRGDQFQALARLKKIEPGISGISSFLVQYQFYSTRAVLYARQKKYTAAEDDYRRAIAAAEGSLGSVKDERDRLAWARSYGSAYRGLAQALIHQSKATDALQAWESFRGSDIRTFSRDAVEGNHAGTAELVAAQRSLGEIPAIVYMLTDDGLAIWAITSKKIELHYVLLDPAVLIHSAELLSSLCGDPNSDERLIREQAKRLYQLLMQPVESYLASDSVIVEPDDGLASLPFEVLLGGDGHYISERTSISYLPSILFVNHVQRSEASRASALVVGVSEVPEPYRKILPPLSDAESEAHDIGAVLGASKVLTGDQANPRNVKDRLADATVFHFAGHSVYENGHLELLLNRSPDDTFRLDIADLSRTKLSHSRLVVLSACSTQGSSGESFHHAQNAVRIVLQARVPQMIASRWDVDSQITSELMKEFYRRFSLNRDASRSLAQAMNQVRRGHQHPYYWAAFSVFGW